MDFLIGKVLESLREKGVLDKTIIIIAGDHGESLGEHGESSRAFFIYDSTVSVPLILKLPSSNLKGKVIDAQMENVDIMPTLLDLLGIAVPKKVQERSLIPLLAGGRAWADRMAYSESYYPRYHYGWSELKSLRTVRYQYIQAPRPELYDIVRDPMERTNIYGQSGPQAERFIKEMKRIQERSPVQGAEEKVPRQQDNDTLEKLRALGYVGEFTSSARTGDRQGEFEHFKEAVKANPQFARGYLFLAKAYLDRNENFDEAIRLTRKGLELEPEAESAPLGHYVLADIYNCLGRLAEYRAELEKGQALEAKIKKR